MHYAKSSSRSLHCLWALISLMVLGLTYTFRLCRKKELYTLRYSHMELGITPNREFRGRKYVRILPRADEKAEQLLVSHTTFIYNDNDSDTQNPKDKWRIVKVVHHYINALTPPDKWHSEEFLCCCIITQSEIKVRATVLYPTYKGTCHAYT